jgi:hypothetical protein
MSGLQWNDLKVVQIGVLCSYGDCIRVVTPLVPDNILHQG